MCIRDSAETGECPKKKPTGKKNHKRNGPPKYQAIADEVKRRRDQDATSFVKLAQELGVGVSTATRAYDYVNRDALETAAAVGETPKRGKYRHIPTEIIDEIRRLLCVGEMTGQAIAKKVGMSDGTVYRERKKLAKKLAG